MSVEEKYCVYFIQMMHGDNPIKIGITVNIFDRLRRLQHAHAYELKVIAVIPGKGRETESELHRRFADSRLRGEWFRRTPELLEFIVKHALQWSEGVEESYAREYGETLIRVKRGGDWEDIKENLLLEREFNGYLD